MSAPVARPSRSVVVAFGLVAMSVLVVQVVLSRLFASIMTYYYAFMLISLAMLGLASGSLLVQVMPRVFTVKRFSIQATICGAAMGLCGIARNARAPRRLSVARSSAATRSHPGQFWALAGLFWCLFPFFLCGGLIVAMVFARYPASFSLLYAVDLVFAAGGLPAGHRRARRDLTPVPVLLTFCTVPMLAGALFGLAERRNAALGSGGGGVDVRACRTVPVAPGVDRQAPARVVARRVRPSSASGTRSPPCGCTRGGSLPGRSARATRALDTTCWTWSSTAWAAPKSSDSTAIPASLKDYDLPRSGSHRARQPVAAGKCPATDHRTRRRRRHPPGRPHGPHRHHRRGNQSADREGREPDAGLVFRPPVQLARRATRARERPHVHQADHRHVRPHFPDLGGYRRFGHGARLQRELSVHRGSLPGVRESPGAERVPGLPAGTWPGRGVPHGLDAGHRGRVGGARAGGYRRSVATHADHRRGQPVLHPADVLRADQEEPVDCCRRDAQPRVRRSIRLRNAVGARGRRRRCVRRRPPSPSTRGSCARW